MKSTKKILYLFSDTGGGHRAAANALIAGVEKESREKVDQKMIDVFVECSEFLGRVSKLYGPVIKFTPRIWGELFKRLNDEKRIDKLLKVSRPFLLKDLSHIIEEFNPDIIVSVHPLLNHIAVEARDRLEKNIPIITVVMDPVTVHKSWVCPDVDLLIVATEDAKKSARKFGMPENKIRKIGIPIDPRFYKKRSKDAVRKELGLDPDIFTILLMGGGEGSGHLYDFATEIDDTGVDTQIIVVCGKNKKIKEKLEETPLTMKHLILGFSKEIPSLMDASDIIVTKAGPGAIAEALAKKLPIIITSWIPGQEEGNVEFIRKKNLGLVEQDPKKVAEKIKHLIDSPEFKKMKKKVESRSQTNTTEEIVKNILSLI